ncbi:MAG: bifunctional DNA-binding transcriptional regulator/O6-methylguanine-DNA methyltransferase Ada [Pseudomonadota bacterium]|nr:bifunctional DNA-binding transcriptional regulator/O6-methylguanine-DNA methyltransferase Ada [Xanthomonadaceae bacterium]MDE2247563.1 bifunctional DNA-binding transcriptional regulator/O6-methylguanine-DNA methyltransferase Ada [Xanthomonadaceae bacterium]MDE3210207.1 bifunctional DNA-binding transcriptional regulator/O6-methylguanine-DNA methyltransferase Ada [Pseudomonadota bacterium]
MKVSATNAERAAAVASDPRWAAVREHDARADGRFFYSVRTTGVYCRPSCAARAARPENVAFHASAEAAERAGFRPCRRCKPDQASLSEQQLALITAACHSIERADTAPSLQQLASAAGLSTFHFHRVFKRVTGVTPKQYASADRADRVRRELARAGTVTEAIFEAGFNASSRFYASAGQRLGMTPGRYRSGGADSDIHFAVGQCSLGAILVAQSPRGVCAILLGDDPDALLRELQDGFPRANLIGADRNYEQLVARVIGLVEAPGIGLELPLDVRGTAFQQRVWQALREIPVGSTASYGEVARRIGAPSAVRAVARACAANKLALAIPCHRVVRNDGSLSGYRWGVERKRALLRREAKA